MGSGHPAEAAKFREWLRATHLHGPLMTRDVVAAALGVSRQRVHQLIASGQLSTVKVSDDRYIPLHCLKEFCAERQNSAYPCPELPEIT